MARGATVDADSDGDGLVDEQELVLRTNPDNSDSDDDGFFDAVEVARHSDPNDRFETPRPIHHDVGMVARSGGGQISLVTAVYSSDGRFGDLNLRFGVVLRGTPFELNRRTLMSSSTFTILTSRTGEGILILKTTFPDRVVKRRGHLSLFAIVEPGVTGTGGDQRVAGLNLVDYGGVIASLEPGPNEGVIYLPLVPEEDLDPSAFNSGEVCYQTTSELGSSGASSVSEVESAECEAMDSSCNPAACAASVGSTIEMIDPGSLIGG